MSDENGNGALTPDEERALRDFYAPELGLLRAFARQHGRAPMWAEWDRTGQRPTAGTMARHFGSWTNAVRAAGLEPVAGPRGMTNLDRARAGLGPRKSPRRKAKR